MAEKIFDAQVNYGWGLSLNMTGKAPAVAKRIFDTYADALAYANDVNDSAIEGLTLSVVNDGDNNGLYFVQQVATKEIPAETDDEGNEIKPVIPAKKAILVKLSTSIENAGSAESVQQNLNQAVAKLEAVDTAISGAVSANTDSITTLDNKVNDAIDEYRAADSVISGAVDANTSAIETINTELDKLLVKDVKDGDSIISLDGEGIISSTLSLEYNKEEQKIYLKGIDDAEIGTIDTTDFVKDGMLSGVTLVKEDDSAPTYMVFAFNTDGGTQTIKLNVEDFLNADEVKLVEDALDLHKKDMVAHITSDEHAKLTNLYDKEALDAKFNEINSALTANTAAHTQLASDIASANTKIDTFSGEVNTFKESFNTYSGNVASQISGISSQISELETANETAHQTLQSNIDSANTRIDETNTRIDDVEDDLAELRGDLTTLSGEVKTLADKVLENEKVTAAALVELKSSKVSSIVSNANTISIVETQDENGISYDLGLQWNEF